MHVWQCGEFWQIYSKSQVQLLNQLYGRYYTVTHFPPTCFWYNMVTLFQKHRQTFQGSRGVLSYKHIFPHFITTTPLLSLLFPLLFTEKEKKNTRKCWRPANLCIMSFSSTAFSRHDGGMWIIVSMITEVFLLKVSCKNVSEKHRSSKTAFTTSVGNVNLLCKHFL